MKYKNIYYLLVFIIFIGTGCSDDDNSPEEGNQENELKTFALDESRNNIPVTSEGSIDGNMVEVFLPPGTDISALVADFTLSENAKAFIEDTEVVSGKSVIDFREVVELTVISESGLSRVYKVGIKQDYESVDEEAEYIMNKYNIPGLQLAVTYKERLVYLKSYGIADKETNAPVTNESLFRVASVSKSVTLAAILKLIENNKLSFDDKVFGSEGILAFDFGTPPYGQHVESVTVKHLVEHKSGWTNYPFDPMFGYPGYNNEELLTEMLDNRSIANTPGTVENYLNFGYFVLARVIEKITGLPYEEYVQQAILEPCGIRNMKVGKTLVTDRFEKEVVYYDQENYSPYLIDVARMDAGGGWIASAEDLTRFLVRMDRNNSKPDILSATSLNYLYLSYGTWVFNGSMSGTASSLSRINDDLGGSVVVNTRAIPDTEMLSAMNSLLTVRVASITKWPKYDLFD